MYHREVAAHLGKLCSLSNLLMYSALQLQASNRSWQETVYSFVPVKPFEDWNLLMIKQF